MDFLNVFKIIETVALLRGIYDPWLAETSVAVAALAALTALSISSHMVAAESSRARRAWASAGASSRSGGIRTKRAPIVALTAHALNDAARNSGVEASKPLVDGWDDELTAAIGGLQALIGESHAA